MPSRSLRFVMFPGAKNGGDIDAEHFGGIAPQDMVTLLRDQFFDRTDQAMRVVMTHIVWIIGTYDDPLRSDCIDQAAQLLGVINHSIEPYPVKITARFLSTAATLRPHEPAMVGAPDIGRQITATVGRAQL